MSVLVKGSNGSGTQSNMFIKLNNNIFHLEKGVQILTDGIILTDNGEFDSNNIITKSGDFEILNETCYTILYKNNIYDIKYDNEYEVSKVEGKNIINGGNLSMVKIGNNIYQIVRSNFNGRSYLSLWKYDIDNNTSTVLNEELVYSYEYDTNSSTAYGCVAACDNNTMYMIKYASRTNILYKVNINDGSITELSNLSETFRYYITINDNIYIITSTNEYEKNMSIIKINKDDTITTIFRTERYDNIYSNAMIWSDKYNFYYSITSSYNISYYQSLIDGMFDYEREDRRSTFICDLATQKLIQSSKHLNYTSHDNAQDKIGPTSRIILFINNMPHWFTSVWCIDKNDNTDEYYAIIDVYNNGKIINTKIDDQIYNPETISFCYLGNGEFWHRANDVICSLKYRIKMYVKKGWKINGVEILEDGVQSIETSLPLNVEI